MLTHFSKSIFVKNKSTQHGVSLVELLIAMTLGLVLLAGMLTVFAGNKQSSELNTALAQIQENARFALSRMSRDMRMAGYQGCLDPNQGTINVVSLESPVATDGTDFDSRQSAATGALVEADGSWNPPIPGGLLPPTVNPAIPGSHVLSIQYGSTTDSPLDPTFVSGTPGNLAENIRTAQSLPLQVGDLALIGNCEAVDLITVTGLGSHNNGLNIAHAAGASNKDGNLSIDYDSARNIAQARVMRFITRVYYVGDTGLQNESGDQIRALYLQTHPFNDAANPPSEIVQGVENMRISYGVRIDGGLSYVTADDSDFDPANVESIRVGLLMRSYDRITDQDDTNTYILAGQPIQALKNSTDAFTHSGNNLYRLVFNTTVKIRNRRNSRIEFN